jgi:hypothetical protein
MMFWSTLIMAVLVSLPAWSQTVFPAGAGGNLEICRSAKVKGGGYDATLDRYAWTCGNYDWSGDAAFVTCTGDGSPDTACLANGEVIQTGGVVTNIMTAVDNTINGGNVYLPEGVYISRGCGAGGTCTTLREAPSNYIRHVSPWRGIQIIGEGPDHNGPLVAGRTGTWLVNDHGWTNIDWLGAPTPDYRGADPDGSGILIGDWVFESGARAASSVCLATSDTDDTCDPTAIGQQGNFKPPSTFIGIANLAIAGDGTGHDEMSEFQVTHENGEPYFFVCLEKDITTKGICREDPRRTCTTATPGPPSAGGCQITGGTDYGPCMDAVDWIEYAVETLDRTDLRLLITQSNRRVDDPLELAGGWQGYSSGPIIAVDDVAGGLTCQSGDGRYVQIGEPPESGGWPFGVEPLYGEDGDDSFSGVKLLDANSINGPRTSFKHISFMPSQWYTRLADDSQVAGCSTTTSGAVSVITLTGCTMTVDAHIGYTVIIDEDGSDGGPHIRTITDNAATTITMDTAHETGIPTLAAGTKDVRISHASCMSGNDFVSDDKWDPEDDERACDAGHLLSVGADIGGGFEENVIWGCSSTTAACFNGSANHIGGKFINNLWISHFRGGIADSAVTVYRGNTYVDVNSWGYMGLQPFNDGTMISDETFINHTGVNGIQLHVGARNVQVSNIMVFGSRVRSGFLDIKFAEHVSVRGLQIQGLTGKGITIWPEPDRGLAGVDISDVHCHVGCAPNTTSFGDFQCPTAVGGSGGTCGKAFAMISDTDDSAGDFYMKGVSLRNINVNAGNSGTVQGADGAAVWIGSELPDEAMRQISLENIRYTSFDSSGIAVVREASDDDDNWETNDAGFSNDLFGGKYVPLMRNIATNGLTEAEWNHRCADVGTDPVPVTCDADHEGQQLCIVDDDGTCADTAGVLDGGGSTRVVCTCQGNAWVK